MPGKEDWAYYYDDIMARLTGDVKGIMQPLRKSTALYASTAAREGGRAYTGSATAGRVGELYAQPFSARAQSLGEIEGRLLEKAQETGTRLAHFEAEKYSEKRKAGLKGIAKAGGAVVGAGIGLAVGGPAGALKGAQLGLAGGQILTGGDPMASLDTIIGDVSKLGEDIKESEVMDAIDAANQLVRENPDFVAKMGGWEAVLEFLQQQGLGGEQGAQDYNWMLDTRIQ